MTGRIASKTHNKLTMYPLGKCPLAPSVSVYSCAPACGVRCNSHPQRHGCVGTRWWVPLSRRTYDSLGADSRHTPHGILAFSVCSHVGCIEILGICISRRPQQTPPLSWAQYNHRDIRAVVQSPHQPFCGGMAVYTAWPGYKTILGLRRGRVNNLNRTRCPQDLTSKNSHAT